MRAGSSACLRDGRRTREADDARSAMAHVKPLTVLLADDYEANRMVQQAQLEELGYPTDAVANGEEVLRALHVRHYDVILLDIGMPVMDGLETARRIRDRKRDAQPFLVAVTAGTVDPDRARIEDAGFDAYIAKPASLHDFAEVLELAYLTQSGGYPERVAEVATSEAALQLDFSPLYARLGPAADGLLQRVIPVFLRELPSRTTRLRAAFAAQDIEALARLCHGLKGASRVVGAIELAAICERLEQRAYAGTLPDARELDALLELSGRTGQELRLKLTALDT